MKMESYGPGFAPFAETEVEHQRILAMTSFVDFDHVTDRSLYSPMNPVSMATLDRISSSSCSNSLESSRSLSSSSLRDEHFDLCSISDAPEGLSDAWLNRDEDDDDLGRLHNFPDSYWEDLFPGHSLLNPMDATCNEPSLASSSLPGFSTFRSSFFDDSLIPTCVSDIGWENDSYPDSVSSVENGSSGSDFSLDNRQQKLTCYSSISGSNNNNFDLTHSNNITSSNNNLDSRVTTSTKQSINNNYHRYDNDDKAKRQRRRPGRPRKTTTKGRSDESTTSSSSSSSSDNDNNNNNISNDLSDPALHRSRRRRKQHPWKGHHLWEFIRELLENNDDPTRSGGSEEELVRWENREKGVFLIVNSKEVAELWGKRKRNEKMTYEKLSRSLRWCRTSGFLAEVPKDRKYPKKLCFCFGHRAYDIHRTTPTTSVLS